ncbi:unnamed protein product [Prunus armeniaca]
MLVLLPMPHATHAEPENHLDRGSVTLAMELMLSSVNPSKGVTTGLSFSRDISICINQTTCVNEDPFHTTICDLSLDYEWVIMWMNYTSFLFLVKGDH